jgi:hypothetical protein
MHGAANRAEDCDGCRKVELREAVEDAVALLDAIGRNADVMRAALRRARVGGSFPLPGDAGYDAKAARIRRALR